MLAFAEADGKNAPLDSLASPQNTQIFNSLWEGGGKDVLTILTGQCSLDESLAINYYCSIMYS